MEETKRLLDSLFDLLRNFERELASPDLRRKVLALVPCFNNMRDVGKSLIPAELASSARDRILHYFRKYPLTIITGDELLVVSGIQEYARRVRELRVQFGWLIVSGRVAREMAREGDLENDVLGISEMRPDDYIMLSTEQDREAAHRWHMANEIRRKNISVKDRILEYLRRNVGFPVSGEELRYVSKDRTEWARRVRELRTEHGWPIATRNTGRPDLGIGVYILEEDRQAPEHDRRIPDSVRREVLRRDGYKCVQCHWSRELWNKDDPRHLEIHHVKPHVEGGSNDAENLISLCNVCHDKKHKKR